MGASRYTGTDVLEQLLGIYGCILSHMDQYLLPTLIANHEESLTLSVLELLEVKRDLQTHKFGARCIGAAGQRSKLLNLARDD